MTESDVPAPSEPPARPEPSAQVEPPPAAKPPARVLPSQEEIADWIDGAEIASVGTLFEGLALKRFDTLVAQLGKADLLPQHWQVIASHGHPDDSEFYALPEVGRLRQRTADPELADRRIDSLLVGWQELRGKRPALWTVPDLLAAMRRIVASRRSDFDWGDLLAATRDVWRDNGLPQGRESLAMLRSSLSFLRTKIKK